MTLLLHRHYFNLFQMHFSRENYRKLHFVSSALQNTTITRHVNVLLQIWGLLGHDWTNLGLNSCMLTLRFLLWILFALYIKPVWNSCCPQEFDACNSLFIVINSVSSIPFLDNGQVFYVDYGNSARLPLSSLRVLRWGENRELQFLH